MNDEFDSIEARCRAHKAVANAGSFPAGTVFGDWRVTAFIGSGGNGEVYCAEHILLGTPAAVKVLVRDEPRSKFRFEREARTLATLKSSAFPVFYAYGESNGTTYCAMELLESGDLPNGDKAVADFMSKLCDAVAELHAHGLVHRDIKPRNILWRNSEPVLSDLGLVKDITQPNHYQSTSQPSDQITLGGVGTPGYGAPEQMERGEATAASDIHSLGVLADRCFAGKPPHAWSRIIERATSSIPDRRFASASLLARAIRCRHLRRDVSIVGLLAIASLLFIVGSRFSFKTQEEDTKVMPTHEGEAEPKSQPAEDVDKETKSWRSMCEWTDIKSVEKVYEPLPDKGTKRHRHRVMQVTNVVKGTVIRLPPGTVTFKKPISLKPGEYRIVGPGRLDADVSGSTNVVVRLKNCVLNNMTESSFPKNGIIYLLEGEAYLNFARLRKRRYSLTPNVKYGDGDGNFCEFSGPFTKEGVIEKRRADSQREFLDEIENSERENSVSDRYRIY